jgi:predicted membrane GTPase involved in stress response
VSFKIATRGLLGLKNALLTATRGMGLVNTIFDEVRGGSCQRGPRAAWSPLAVHPTSSQAPL